MNLDWPPRIEPEAGEEYENYAEVYDLVFDQLDQDVAFYLRTAGLHLPAGGTLLELGTGTGRLTWRLLDAGYDVVGVDPSEPMLRRAALRLAGYAPRSQLVHANGQDVRLEQRFALAIAPFGMMAHLLDDRDRLALFRNMHDHLAPGGVFVFDDMPGWMAGPSDSSRLELRRTARDEATGLDLRVMSNLMDVADAPLMVRFDFVDWLNASQEVVRRVIVRVRFRNIALADELALLKEAGFAHVELLGGFDGRPLDLNDLSANTRLVLKCTRA